MVLSNCAAEVERNLPLLFTNCQELMLTVVSSGCHTRALRLVECEKGYQGLDYSSQVLSKDFQFISVTCQQLLCLLFFPS